MTISTVLQTVYASAPAGVVLLATLEIQIAGQPPLRLVHAYDDQQLGVDGKLVPFEACSIQLALPKKNTSGQQTLTFGLGLVDGRADRAVADALEAGQPVYMVYREYISTDPSAPARAPIKMVVQGGKFEGPVLQVEASYYDLLNAAWPRERYTADKAPGIKYMP